MNIDEWEKWYDDELYPDPAMIKHMLLDWQADRNAMLKRFEDSVQTIAKLYMINQTLIKSLERMRTMVRRFLTVLSYGSLHWYTIHEIEDWDKWYTWMETMRKMVGCNDDSTSRLSDTSE